MNAADASGVGLDLPNFSRSKKARKTNPVARSLTEQAYRSGKNALVSAYHSAGEVGGKVRRAMPRLALDLNRRDINRTIRTVVDDRPVVLGIIGFGVGVALAAVIPIFSHQGKSRK